MSDLPPLESAKAKLKAKVADSDTHIAAIADCDLTDDEKAALSEWFWQNAS